MALRYALAGLLSASGLAQASAADWPMVGWDTYRNYDLAAFRPGEITKQFSSYDRSNNNDDGFEGTYSCLSFDDEDRCVIAKASGPGEISSIWFTYASDSVAEIGSIKIELDQKVVLEGDLQAVVNSELGSPWKWPLVGNTNDTNGGNVIKVPMTYSKSMVVSTENNPHFYHVTYREFPKHTKVKTFDPKEDVKDVFEAHESFGVKDPKFSNQRGDSGHKELKVKSKGEKEIQLTSEGGTVTMLQLRVPEISGAVNEYDDGRAFGKGGSSKMTLKLDPANRQCRLTRRIDASIGHQSISVKVDGQMAGKLATKKPREGVFVDQTLDLAPKLTAGKSSIEVQAEFVSSDLDINEFAYALHCKARKSWKSAAYGPSKDWTLMDLLNVGPNNPRDEEAHGYVIKKETWNGVRNYTYTGDRASNAVASTQLLSQIKLSLEFDDKTTVSEVPLGSFFGNSLAKHGMRSLLLSVDAMQDNGAFTSWFPMPAESKATLTIHNESPHPIAPTVDWVVAESPRHETKYGSSWGHFSIQHHREDTINGTLWSFLSETGPGTMYGVTHTFRGSILPPANDLEFLEGDEQVYIGRTTPPKNLINDTTATLLGTGTEDFYESGWYFSDASVGDDGLVGVPYSMPLVGFSGRLTQQHDLGCVGQCLDTHRLMVPDSSAFGEDGISFNIEHGPTDNIPVEYESCAFYYK